MIKSFFWNKKWLLWAYLGGFFLLCSLYSQVHMSVMINSWYGDFYDLIQDAPSYVKNDKMDEGVSKFWGYIKRFFWIAMPYVLLATITNYFTRIYAFKWREAITFDYIPRWKNVEHEIEGASQRIQEDTYRFTRIVESLGLQIVRALMTLMAFTPILWSMSAGISVPVLGAVPGSLVWVAVFVSVGGLLVSWLVGWKLPGLEYNNQKVEAAFRKELVYGEDDKINYCSLKV